MIDLRNESALSLSQAARLLPPSRRGRPVSLSCLLRWVLNGVKTPNGVIRLEAIRLGGRWITSHEALARFADRQTLRLDEEPQGVARSRTPTRRQRASQRAADELEKNGI